MQVFGLVQDANPCQLATDLPNIVRNYRDMISFRHANPVKVLTLSKKHANL